MENSSLSSLATYINSLPLTNTNRKWLAEQIMNPTLYVAEIKGINQSEGLLSFAGMWKDDPDADRMFDAIQRN